MNPANLLHEHYVFVVREIERLVHAQMPHIPLVKLEPKPLADGDVHYLADLLVAGHSIAERQRRSA